MADVPILFGSGSERSTGQTAVLLRQPETVDGQVSPSTRQRVLYDFTEVRELWNTRFLHRFEA